MLPNYAHVVSWYLYRVSVISQIHFRCRESILLLVISLNAKRTIVFSKLRFRRSVFHLYSLKYVFEDQNLDIEKLSKGRPQDNLELIQFMRDLFDRVYDGHKYNPVLSRAPSKGGRGIH